MAVQVQFTYGQEDRLSPVYGPYDYIEMTYNGLWSPERGGEIAYIDHDGLWHAIDGATYTDFTVVSSSAQL